VVLKAELAQSYITQPKISRRSFFCLADVVGMFAALIEVILSQYEVADDAWILSIGELYEPALELSKAVCPTTTCRVLSFEF